MEIIRSTNHDPEENAMEELRLFRGDANDVLLYFYINEPSVHVGRNQRIIAEIDIPYCHANDITIHRRLTGGGTVYHDLGNINYAFIAPCAGVLPLESDGYLQLIVQALRCLDVPVEIGEHRDIWLYGRKISGTASLISRRRILFHGTLLHRADLMHLIYALRGDTSLRGRSIASRPSPVANIAELTFSLEPTSTFLTRLIACLS
jgi:lipoate-protein ligase A